MAWRLASGVSWRCWDDGCVVFSAATAQTLLLSAEFGSVLAAADAAPPAGGAARARTGEIDETLVGRLVELGILERSA